MMVSRREWKPVWITGAALLVLFVGVGVTVFSHRLIGGTLILSASLLLIAVALKIAAVAKPRERQPLLILVAGYVLMLGGGAISLYYSGLPGAMVSLLGAMTGLAGSVALWFRSRGWLLVRPESGESG